MSDTTRHWEHFAHEADMGVRGFGPTKADAFAQTALALTNVITDSGAVADKQAVELVCEADDDEFLLVEWLNALVYEMSVRKMLFARFDVRIDGHRLQATAFGERIDVARHQPAVEVKGATLTALEVAQTPDGAWRAQCIVDV